MISPFAELVAILSKIGLADLAGQARPMSEVDSSDGCVVHARCWASRTCSSAVCSSLAIANRRIGAASERTIFLLREKTRYR